MEWDQIDKVLSKYPENFPGYDRDLYIEMFNFACTRCFGWSLPDTMMVPLADFMNHLPIDTQFGVYDKISHTVKKTVDSGEPRKLEEIPVTFGVEHDVDYSLVYS
jgi:hypothetical protein